jgi:hypothetical protein
MKPLINQPTYIFLLLNIAAFMAATLFFECSPGLPMLHIIGTIVAVYSTALSAMAIAFGIYYLLMGE